MLFLKFNEYSKAEYEDLYKQIPGEHSLVLEMKRLAMHDAYHIKALWVVHEIVMGESKSDVPLFKS
ncbi:hypothetical protein LBYS11_07705 [Lysinibacillus sp. YS11]|uniref:hypothetical protein n=1 Tax=Lysinibacillus capsici TaxID=2115968 RepID=UPI000CA24246|nr:hypothetical protein [Lysinibacillus capsici]AUS86223.1 hypothetical protein LBYS11_07705 [Lysinibacillus sp. YS11]MCT1538846.1 hypothetical protein [Lysinibacillus capsici]RDV30476.1 hypothetical protein C7B89_13435 [Lysinibacillus capsici]